MSKEESRGNEAAQTGGSEEEGLIEAFLSTYDRLQTQKSYGHDLRDFFGTETVTLSEVQAPREEEVREYLVDTEQEKGTSAARRRRAALRSFYQWAYEEGVLSRETAETIRRASLEETSGNPLSED